MIYKLTEKGKALTWDQWKKKGGCGLSHQSQVMASDVLDLPDKQSAVEQAKKDQLPRITRAYREFLPRPGPEQEGRRSIGGDVSQGPASSSGSIGSSAPSSGGSKKKSKKK